MFAIVFAFALIYLVATLIRDIINAIAVVVDTFDAIHYSIQGLYEPNHFSLIRGSIPFDIVGFGADNDSLRDLATRSGCGRATDKICGNDQVRIKKKNKTLRVGCDSALFSSSAQKEFVNLFNKAKIESHKHPDWDLIYNHKSSILDEFPIFKTGQSKSADTAAKDTSEDRTKTRWGLIDVTGSNASAEKPIHKQVPVVVMKVTPVRYQQFLARAGIYSQPTQAKKVGSMARKQSVQSLEESNSYSEDSSFDSVPVASPPVSPLPAEKEIPLVVTVEEEIDNVIATERIQPNICPVQEAESEEAMPEVLNSVPSFSFDDIKHDNDDEEAFGNFVEIETSPYDHSWVAEDSPLTRGVQVDYSAWPNRKRLECTSVALEIPNLPSRCVSNGESNDDEESSFGQFADIEDSPYDGSWVAEDSPLVLGVQIDYSAWPNRKRLECKSKRTPEESKDRNPRPTKRCKAVVVGC